MARRMPPSSSSLSVLSHLLARTLDEAVASAASALRIRPRFFEGGFGDLSVVDFRKDELVASLSKFDQEKRQGFGAWLEDAERGPVLEVRRATSRGGPNQPAPPLKGSDSLLSSPEGADGPRGRRRGRQNKKFD